MSVHACARASDSWIKKTQLLYISGTLPTQSGSSLQGVAGRRGTVIHCLWWCSVVGEVVDGEKKHK